MGDKTLSMPQISLHSRVASPSDSSTNQKPTDLSEEVGLDEQIPSMSADQRPTEESANVVDVIKEENKAETTIEMEGLVSLASRSSMSSTIHNSL
jgi:hypothetical protein